MLLNPFYSWEMTPTRVLYPSWPVVLNCRQIFDTRCHKQPVSSENNRPGKQGWTRESLKLVHVGARCYVATSTRGNAKTSQRIPTLFVRRLRKDKHAQLPISVRDLSYRPHVLILVVGVKLKSHSRDQNSDRSVNLTRAILSQPWKIALA